MNNVSFTSVIVNTASINNFMPKQALNIDIAAQKLTKMTPKQAPFQDVFIKAISPKALEMEVKIDGIEKPLIKRILDRREINAKVKKIADEDTFYKTIGRLPEEEKIKINQEHQNLLKEIKETPFDFESEIINIYQDLISK